MSQEVQDILEITRKAGELLQILSKDPLMRQPVKKADGSPVTAADQKVSDYLVAVLKPLGYPVISEEALPGVPPEPGSSYFLVDPLDGTKYFARGEKEFAICVGLLKKGHPFMGAIFDPTANLLYWAVRGEGAFCEDQPISHPGVQDGLTVFSSGFHKRPERKQIVEALHIDRIEEKGSALKFCDLASGKADLYLRFGPTSEWDTAAAQVLMEEANGFLYEVKTLETMKYGKKRYLNRGILAGHKSQAEPVAELLRTMGPFNKKGKES